jgi:voltage-gated potassium channel
LFFIKKVFYNKKEELMLSFFLTTFLLIVSSTLLYYCENPMQPDEFSSIPASMWWAIAALTTVGYGDLYPITIMGKILASVIAVLGISVFALPTGIISAGLIEEIQKPKEPPPCIHCGKNPVSDE